MCPFQRPMIKGDWDFFSTILKYILNTVITFSGSIFHVSLGTAPSSWFQMLMTSLWSIKSIIRNDALKHFFRNLEILEYFFSPGPLICIQFNLKNTFLQEISFFSYMSLKNFAVKSSAAGVLSIPSLIWV